MGPHIEHPNAFLSAAKERWRMAGDALDPHLSAGAAYFPTCGLTPGHGPITGKDVFIAIRDRDEADLGIVVRRELQKL